METDEGAPFFDDENFDITEKDLIAKLMAKVTAEHADPIVPKPHIQYTSAGFQNPIHFICLGVNSQFALAIRGPPETVQELRKLWVNQERIGFYCSWMGLFKAYKGHWSRDKLKVEQRRMEIISAFDMTLKQPAQRVMKKIAAELIKLKADDHEKIDDFSTIPIAKRSQPCGEVEFETKVLDEDETLGVSSDWSLAICLVPKKEARRAPPGWKSVINVAWNVAPGTVPAVAFNETHVVALYSQKDQDKQVTLECGTIVCNSANGKHGYTKVWQRVIPIPDNVAGSSFSASARLSPQGTLTLALCNVIYVIPISDPTRALIIRMGPHVMVTATWFCDESNGITWGTQAGETFHCNATNMEDMQTLFTPVEEPVLAVQRDAAIGGRWIVQTWMSVLGRLSPGGSVFKALPMERPLAFASRGPLLYVLTKHGKLDVFRPGQADTPLRGLLKIEKMPPMVTQYTYDGLATIGQNGLAALLPSGQVHYFEWE